MTSIRFTNSTETNVNATFHGPEDPAYEFRMFYEKVKAKGFILY